MTYWGKVAIFIVLFVVVVQTLVSGATIKVPDDYRTIQTAVDRARPFDTIVIRPGAYHERVEIPKPLTLMGASETQPTAPGGSLLPSLEGCPVTGCSEPVIIGLPGGPAIEIRSDNVTLKGLRLEAVDTCLVLESADRVSVRDDIFGDCRICIAGFDTIGTDIEGNSFVQCRKTALQLTSTTDAQITSNHFQGGLTGVRGDGITRWHLERNRFQNLSVVANLNGMADSVIGGNTFVNCTLGYLLISSRNTTISGDTLENSEQYLFLLNSFSTEVTVGAYGNATTISKDIDSSSVYRIGKVTLTGTNFAFSLFPQTPTEGYQTPGDRIHITFLDTSGEEQGPVQLDAQEDLRDWKGIDPFTFGFYRVDGKRPLFTGTTHITGNLMRTSTTLKDSADGTYALMAKRRVPFESTIEGIALVIVIIAAAAGFALHRRRLSRKKRESQGHQAPRISTIK